MKKAKCIATWSTLNLVKNPLTLGRLYTIIQSNRYGMIKVICDNGEAARYNTKRFEIVNVDLNDKIKVI